MSGHQLEGAVVAVVGATGALGSRLAAEAAHRGAAVVLVGRDEARLRGVLDGAEVVVGDLCDATLGDRVVEAAHVRHGRLDGRRRRRAAPAHGDRPGGPGARW